MRTPARRPGSAGRRPLRREWPTAVVLAGLLAGLALVWVDRVRAGTTGMGAAVLLAALLRLVLPEPRAGMLAVRRRGIDAVVLAALGAAIVALPLSMPALR